MQLRVQHPAIIAARLAVAGIACAARVTAGAQAPAADSGLSIGTPTLVAPGIISRGLSESAATLTPDGATMYLAVTDRAFTRMTIMESARRKGEWTEPHVASFSGKWNDGSPSLSPDGKRLFFISNRPVVGSAATPALDLWFVDRTATGWSTPKHADGLASSTENVAYPSAALDGTLYFMIGGKLYKTIPSSAGTYAQRVSVLVGGDGFRVVAAAVSSDQRFMVVAGPGASPTDTDLFIAFADGSGGWGPLRRLAAPVNSTSGETSPYITSDGKTLYFSSDRILPFTERGGFWPRAKSVSTYRDVEAELLAQPMNGQRDIYQVSLEALARIP